jgi:hypothetical protein
MKKIYGMILEALKNNELNYLLRGEGAFTLPKPYMSPSELPTDWDLILKDGVYEFYRNKPSEKIDLKLEKSLVDITGDLKGIYCALNIFWIQLMNEEYGSSPFILKKDKIISELSIKLISNKEGFLRDKRWAGVHEKNGLWGEIIRICEDIKNEYKIKLI